MLEHTEKHPTDMVELCFIGPAEQAAAAAEALHGLGFSKAGENPLVDWTEVFPDKSPASLLSGARYRENLTQQQLAGLTGIPRRHISEMENNKRPIGKESARKLAAALNTDYRYFL